MLRFVIAVATAAACIAGADLANAGGGAGGGGGALPLAQKPDELYGTACQHPFKAAFSCPGSGM